jgi:hypothetical protein
MTFPNPKWQPAVSDTIDNAAAVDKGGGEVGLPITGHAFLAEQVVVIAGTTNYDGAYAINSKTTNEIVITATYVAETFAGTETVDFGRQPITKADFLALENQIQSQPSVRLKPPLVWVDAGTIRVEATADCPAETALTGMPNIMNPVCQADGGLSDGKVRTITANVSCIFGAGGLYGTTQTEKASQWYAIFALAGDTDTDFELKAMPFMRFSSQASQVITLRNNLNAANIGYGFTTDELIGAMIYVLSGASKGLMRPIIHNNNNDATGGTIEYSGTALTMTQGDWFIVLPATNFRWIGNILNNASSNIDGFIQCGDLIQWNLGTGNHEISVGSVVVEDIRIACPMATEARLTMWLSGERAVAGHPLLTNKTVDSGTSVTGDSAWGTVDIGILNCKYYIYANNCYRVAYRLPS